MELKIFTDATIKKNNKATNQFKGSFGGYLTDKNGQILLNFFSPFEDENVKLKASNIAILEAEGISMALDYAIEMRATKVSVYTDNLLCVQMVNNYLMNPIPEDYKPSLLHTVSQKDVLEKKTKNIFAKLNRFEDFEIKHLRRFNNQYADYLAEYGFSLFHKSNKQHKDFVRRLSEMLISDINYDFILEKKMKNQPNI